MCLVPAVCFYLDATSSLAPHPRSLSVSPRCPSHALSTDALSYFLRQVISDAGAIWDASAGTSRAHSVGVLRIQLLSCGTGQSPRCLRQRLGGRIQSSPRFILRT